MYLISEKGDEVTSTVLQFTDRSAGCFTKISFVFALSSKDTVLCCDVARSRCGVKGSGEVPRLGRTFPVWDDGVTSAFSTVHVTCHQFITLCNLHYHHSRQFELLIV
jgi:hypothetical protein